MPCGVPARSDNHSKWLRYVWMIILRLHFSSLASRRNGDRHQEKALAAKCVRPLCFLSQGRARLTAPPCLFWCSSVARSAYYRSPDGIYSAWQFIRSAKPRQIATIYGPELILICSPKSFAFVSVYS